MSNNFLFKSTAPQASSHIIALHSSIFGLRLVCTVLPRAVSSIKCLLGSVPGCNWANPRTRCLVNLLDHCSVCEWIENMPSLYFLPVWAALSSPKQWLHSLIFCSSNSTTSLTRSSKAGALSCPKQSSGFSSALSCTLLHETIQDIILSLVYFISCTYKTTSLSRSRSKAGALSCPKQSPIYYTALCCTLLLKTINNNILYISCTCKKTTSLTRSSSISFHSRNNPCSALKCMHCSSKQYTHIYMVMMQSRVFSSSSDNAAPHITITGLHYTIVYCAALFLKTISIDLSI